MHAIRYGTRIGLARLGGDGVGGLAPAALTQAVAAIRNASLDARTAYTFGLNGQVAASTDALGVRTLHTYNSFGEERQRITGAREERFSRDRRGLLSGTSLGPAAVASTQGLQRDAFGRIVRATDANGHATTVAFDRLGRVVQTVDALGAARSSTYDAFARELTQTDALGHTTRHAYDPVARSLATTTPEGVRVVTHFDRHGQVLSVTDGRGATTTYDYDRDGRLLQTAAPLASTGNTYDRAGRLIATTDANGTQTLYTYDAADRQLTRRVDPLGLDLTTRYQYDAHGRQVQVTDAAGTLTVNTFDLRGQRTAVTVDPAGLNLRTTYAYDPQGQVLAVTQPSGARTAYAYDALGRRVREQVDPAGLNLTRHYRYDANGNLAASVDANGQTTRYTYDAANRLVYTSDPLGNGVSQAYDAEGRLARTTRHATPSLSAPAPADAARDIVESRRYDKDGRLRFTVDGVGAVVAYRHDANGNVTEERAYANPIDRAAWDPATDPVPLADDARDIRGRNVHDAANRLAWRVDGTGAVTGYEYDPAGRVLRERRFANPVPEGQAPQGVVASDADRITEHVHDAAGRRVYQLQWSDETDPAAAGSRLRRVTSYLHDAAGRVISETAHAAGLSSGVPGDPARIAGSLAANPALDRTHHRVYDAAGRLTHEVDAEGALTRHSFDANGNLAATTRYYATVDVMLGLIDPVRGIATWSRDHVLQLAAGEPPPAAVDAEGPVDRTTRYSHDAANRLVFTVDGRGYATALRHDGLGHVIQTTRYHKAGATLGQAAGPADAVEKSLYDAGGRLVSTTDAQGYTERHAYDALGRKTAFTNKNGAVWTYAHDAAGRMVQETSPKVELAAVTLDAAGNLKADPANSATAPVVTRMAYDALGNLLARTEAFGRPEARTTFHAYDALGRQVRTTFAPVGVHDAARDDLAANGASGLAARVETLQALYTETTYDALGNAVRNRDVAGGLSFKAYDRAGRVRRETDALGHVTEYTRNAFGDVTRLLRHGEASAASPAPDAGDRAVRMTHDRMGRLVRTQEAETLLYNPNNLQHERAGGDTVQTWNAFGELVRIEQEQNLTGWGGSSSVTEYHHDRAGNRTHILDPESYLTVQRFDGAGNMVERVERSISYYHFWGRTDDSPGLGRAGTPRWVSWQQDGRQETPHADDRITRFSYDPAGRKTSETWVDVEYSTAADGSSLRGNLTTTYAYDAVGNQTRVTDASGASTYSLHDALGRVRAVTEPPRVTDAGTTVSPLTVFRRDAHGNAVQQVEYAHGAGAVATGQHGTPVRPDAVADRASYTRFDSLGRAIQRTDAMGVSRFSAYNAQGLLAKEWQGVTDADGVVRTLFRAYGYDALGRQTRVYDPASTSALVCAPHASESPATFGADGWPLSNGRVTLAWSNLVDGAGGTVRVQVDYMTGAAEPADADESGNTVTPIGTSGGARPPQAATQVRFFAPGEAAQGIVALAMDEPLGHVTRYKIEQQDGTGGWVTKWEGTPAEAQGSRVAALAQPQAGLVETRLEYNAFGELVSRGIGEGREEYFDYDAAGRLWRTNAGDGVDRVLMYNRMGQQTLEIRSAGLDLRAYGSAAEVAALADARDVRRTDFVRDTLGRVIVQTGPGRAMTDAQGAVTLARPEVAFTYDRWGNTTSASDPRARGWKTTYRYNANDQLVEQSQHHGDADPRTPWLMPGPVTRLSYDAMGRQVAVRDANGNVNGQAYDAAGQLVAEMHADGGVVRHAYDAFGNKAGTVDALGRTTLYGHDKLDRLVRTVRPVVDVYSVDAAKEPYQLEPALRLQGSRAIVETQAWDEAGRLSSRTSDAHGNDETIRYAYDLRGNIVRTTQPLGQVTQAAFDAHGRKVAEVDGNGFAATWALDYFGRVRGHADIGGARYGYAYDHAGQLSAQWSSRGQDLAYGYDAAGQLVRVDDKALGQVSTYDHDLAGRRIRETTVQGGVTYQDSRIAYDALGRMRRVEDGRASLAIDYDLAGNRTHIATSVVNDPAARPSDRWFRYDAMNRQIVVDGVDAAGNITSAQGHVLGYDLNGNRTSDTGGGHTEVYSYDALDRLGRTYRDGVLTETRVYDGAGRVVHSGAEGFESQLSRYDANGRLLHQVVRGADGKLHHELSFERPAQAQPSAPPPEPGVPTMRPISADWEQGMGAVGYDGAGNLRGYTVLGYADGEASSVTGHEIETERAEG